MDGGTQFFDLFAFGDAKKPCNPYVICSQIIVVEVSLTFPLKSFGNGEPGMPESLHASAFA